jgi:hypothetical protein
MRPVNACPAHAGDISAIVLAFIKEARHEIAELAPRTLKVVAHQRAYLRMPSLLAPYLISKRAEQAVSVRNNVSQD